MKASNILIANSRDGFSHFPLTVPKNSACSMLPAERTHINMHPQVPSPGQNLNSELDYHN